VATANYKFSVSWTGLSTFVGLHNDVTSLVTEATWDYGRDYASQLRGKSNAGRMTWRLINNSGRFNSFNSDSPLSANLIPGRPIQVEMEVSGTSAVMWNGFIDEIKPEPDVGGRHRVRISARGALHKINQEQVDISMQSNISTGSAINIILDGVSWPASARSVDEGIYIMPDFWIKNKRKALNVLRGVENTEFGFIRETKDGKIAFEDRHHRLSNDHAASVSTYKDDTGGDIRFQGCVQLDPFREIANSIEVPVNQYFEGATGLLWTLAQTGQASPAIGVNSSQVFFADYPSIDSQSDAVGVDSWITPDSTDVVGNSSSDGSGTDFSSNVAIAVSKFDTAMKITLTNNNSGTAFITLLKARGVPKLQPDTVNIRSEDSSSQTKFGVRKFPVQAEFIGSVGDAQLYADVLKESFKDPIRKIGLEFEATLDSTHLVEARDRDVSDRITVNASSASQLGINADFYVENMRHVVKDGGHTHRVSMELSPVSGFGANFWALSSVGQSELSASTHLIF